jgi:hypothetical protein
MNTFHVIRRADLALGDRFSTRNRNWRGRLRLTEARERVFQAAFDHTERTGATLKGYINLLAWHSHPGNDARVCHAFYETRWAPCGSATSRISSPTRDHIA